MARHGFGRGSTGTSPIRSPSWSRLRTRLYPHSCRSPIAGTSAWAATRFPAEHARLSRALPRRGPASADAAAAALRGGRLQLPAPGPLRRARLSAAGGGAAVQPGDDFSGGEFVLTEQRPRMQSRVEVVPLARATRWSSRSTTGRCRARAATIGSVRHGVSRVRSGSSASPSGSSSTTPRDPCPAWFSSIAPASCAARRAGVGRNRGRRSTPSVDRARTSAGA